MPAPPEDVSVKVATSIVQDFVETYYSALNNPNRRSILISFYVNPADGSLVKPDITINGNIISNPVELQQIFESQIQKAQYDVQSYDCHVLNANYNSGAPDESLGPDKHGKNISVIAMVSGSVKYWKEGEDGDTRGFTESVILVPNRAAYGPKNGNGAKRWLILSQTFRLVV